LYIYFKLRVQIHLSTQSKPSRILKAYASSGTLVKEGITQI
jgi:hypothetical protein